MPKRKNGRRKKICLICKVPVPHDRGSTCIRCQLDIEMVQEMRREWDRPPAATAEQDVRARLFRFRAQVSVIGDTLDSF